MSRAVEPTESPGRATGLGGSGATDRSGPHRWVTDRWMPIAAVLDTVAVVVFVAVGRRTHDQDPGIAGTMYVAAPFLIALVAGWVVARAWRHPAAVVTGVVVWAVTVVGGMLLRNLVFDRGTATAFVVVATAFLAACLIGWRLVALAVARLRQHKRPARS